MNVLMYTTFQWTRKCNKISKKRKFASCISDKIFKFSVYELLKLRQYAILCCICDNYNFLNHNNSSFDLSHLCMHKHTRTHTHTHTHTHAKSSFLMKTSDLIKILGKLREIN